MFCYVTLSQLTCFILDNAIITPTLTSGFHWLIELIGFLVQNESGPRPSWALLRVYSNANSANHTLETEIDPNCTFCSFEINFKGNLIHKNLLNADYKSFIRQFSHFAAKRIHGYKPVSFFHGKVVALKPLDDCYRHRSVGQIYQVPLMPIIFIDISALSHFLIHTVLWSFQVYSSQ